MRIAVGMLICLGGLSAAWANEPPSPNPAAAAPAQQPTATDQGKPAPGGAPSTAPAESSATTAPAGASAPAATTSKSENALTSAAAAPTSAAAQASKTAALTDEEKKYLSHGYKLQTRGGQKYFCHSETTLGTRFASTICRTSEQMAAATQNSKDFAAEMQRPGWNGQSGMASGGPGR